MALIASKNSHISYLDRRRSNLRNLKYLNHDLETAVDSSISLNQSSQLLSGNEDINLLKQSSEMAEWSQQLYYAQTHQTPYDFSATTNQPSSTSSSYNYDLIWRNDSTGDDYIWFMEGTKYANGTNLTAVGDTNCKLEASADFNSDGKTDFVWRNYATGQNVAWLMDGTNLTGSADLTAVSDTNWKIEAAADFNSDGKTDLAWRNYATGQNVVWFMNGTNITSSAYLTTVSDRNWKIEAAADFNGDGKTDLAWRNYATGENVVWFMNGANIASSAYLTTVSDSNWKIEAAADFNSDGKSDLVWRSYATGENVIWFMNGANIASSTYLSTVSDRTWKIVGTSTRYGDYPHILSPFSATPDKDLVYRGGRTIPNLNFVNIYLGGDNSWSKSDIQNIDWSLSQAMSDRRLNNIMSQYFPGQQITSNFIGSVVVGQSAPDQVSKEDLETLVMETGKLGGFDGFDLNSTVFDFMLPRGTVLVDSKHSSLVGLGGFHGSVYFQKPNSTQSKAYYSVGVYSENYPYLGIANGIPVFDEPWKNVVATAYHELSEFRTDPDVSDANRTGNFGYLGWYSDEGGEVGDFPVTEASQQGSLGYVFGEIPLANGKGNVPIQIQYSNRVNGPENPMKLA
jgi:hypothetical protein